MSYANGVYDTINHFACKFAKYLPIFKTLSPANSKIYMWWSNPSQHKCLAILLCDLSLITIRISDRRQFSDIHISQGSVATYLRCGGKIKNEFVTNLPVSLSAKELWKSVIIWGSYGQEFSVLFFIDSRCSSELLIVIIIIVILRRTNAAWTIKYTIKHTKRYKKDITQTKQIYKNKTKSIKLSLRRFSTVLYCIRVAEWLACWTQAQ